MTPQALRDAACQWLEQQRPAFVVRVVQVQGSTPRETDARMLVSLENTLGTIGGGHLEWQAVAMSRQALREHGATRGLASWEQRFALGPSLGQCCGGAVVLAFEPLTASSLPAWPATTPLFHLDLHGAGHVGQALVNILQGLDCSVRWIDQRLDDPSAPVHTEAVGLPDLAAQQALPKHIHCLPTDDAVAEVAQAPWGSRHLVLTHRHDLDLDLVDAILRREDIQQGCGWVGMIGSRTKRAAFEHRLQARGHAPAQIAQLVCPIGLPGIAGKSPQVIAVSVAAQLLAGDVQVRP